MQNFVLVQKAFFIWCVSTGLRPVYRGCGRLGGIIDEYGFTYEGPEPSYVDEYRRMLDAKATAEEADSYW
jgi:hypothetical protein